MNTNERSRYVSAAVSAALSFAAAAVHAGPQNGTVTNGAATISTPASNLTQIDQTTNSVSIDWQSFDVAANERVNFNQPSSSSVALNRILTQDPSQILGTINANGRIFLLNPNGIIFGASARVNVGSLVASSLDLTEADAAAGRFSFGTSAAQSGAIVNAGALTATNGGSITLLGGSVLNTGLIVADYGTVNLGAGRAATLSFDGDGLMRFQIDAGLLTDSNGTRAAVDNSGHITADGGQVFLTAQQAGDVVARAVNNDGVIRAARIENSGGVIRLIGGSGTVVNGGTLDASGSNGTGGQISVLGESVALGGTSLVDVSGTHGGGTALIGGGFAGADPAVTNARTTTVDAGAVIRADSTTAGDAGRIAVWADDTTSFNGQVLARASGASGNGGFIEVSGRRYLSMGGSASTASENGLMGMLLLDPGSVRIVDGNTGANDSPNVFTDGWINGQLDSTSVTIQTSAADTGPETIAIEADVAIAWDGDATLTLEAGESITMDATSSIINTERASGPGAGVGDLQISAGLLGGAGGGITLDGTLSVAGNLGLSAAGTAGAITTTAAITAGGTATLNAASAVALDSVTAGSLSVTAGGDISQSAAFSIAGTTNLAAAGQDVTLNEANEFTGAVTLAAASASLTADAATNLGTSTVTNALSLTTTTGGITQSGAVNAGSTTFVAAGGVAVNDTLNAGTSLTITAGGPITQSGAITTAGLASFTTRNDAGAAITLNGVNSFGSVAASVRNAANTANAAAGISITEANDTQLAGNLRTAAGQTVTVSSGGNITQTGSALTAAGNVLLTAGGGTGSITLESANAVTGSIGFDAAAVSFDNAGNTALRASDVTGNLTIGSAGAITQTGALSVGGNASFTAGPNQSITLGAGNTFNGDIAFASTGTLDSVTVVDTTALTLQPMTLSGNLTATGASISTGAITVGADLDLTATTGGIAQTAALQVTGDSSFTANAGQSILLGEANTFTGAVSLAGDGGNLLDVTLRDVGALSVSALNVSGDLTITAASLASQALTVGGALDLNATAGGISQTGAFAVSGNATFGAAVGQAILLGQANDFSGTVAFVGNGGNLGNVTVRDTTALDLPALTISGNLAATGATLSQSGGLSVAGTSTFTAGQGTTITFDRIDNALQGAVRFGSSGPGALQDVTLRNGVATNLGVSTIGGALNVTASGGDITQSGALSVGGAATFTASTGQSIIVDNAGNVFTGSVGFVGAGGNLSSVSVADTTDLTLQSLTVGNDLTARAANIEAQALSVGGDLALTASGDIAQTAAIDVAGNSIFTADAGRSIALGEANTFNGTVSFVGDGGNLANVTVRDTTALDLQPLSVSGDLAATAASLTSQALTVGGDLALTATAGGISQAAAMSVTGDSTFTAATGEAITLAEANTFTGNVGFIGAGGNLGSVTVRDSNALTLQTLAVNDNLAVTAASIAAQQLTVGGNLSLTATTGGITQTAAMNVTGNSTFTADAGQSILLGQANTFAGTVAFVGDGGNLNNVTLQDSSTIDLQALSLAGNLNVTATSGAITQSGALDIDGSATFTAAAGQSVSLIDAANDFAGVVTFLGSGGNLADVSVHDASALTLGGLTLDGSLTVNADSIAQSAALVIGGNSAFTASGGQSIDLDNAGNAFAGTVSFAPRSGTLQNVSIADTTALDLQALALDGDLSVSAASITQSGAVSVGGTATLISDAGVTLNTTNAGALAVTAGGAVAQTGALSIAGTTTIQAGGQDIALTSAGNVFGGSIAITAETAALANSTATTIAASTLGSALTVDSVGAIAQTGAIDVAGGATSLTSDAGVALATINTGTLTIGAGASVSQSGGALNVSGNTSIDASGQNVTLNAANTFAGSIAVIAANASLTNSTATTLGASTIGNSLTVSSAGAIGQSGALSVAGTSTFDATGQNVTLTAVGNALVGGITLDSATATLNNTVATNLLSSTIADDLTVSSTGAIVHTGTLDVGTAAFSSGSTVSLGTVDADSLSVSAAGGISQSGALTVAGETTIAAAGQSVALGNAANDFGGGVAITGADVSIVDADSIDLRASTVSGNLDVTAIAGTLTQSDALSVAGNSTFTAADGQSILLTNAGNAFGGIRLASSGQLADVSLAATTGLDLQGLDISGDLTVTSGGPLTQSGTLTVAGVADFDTSNPGSSITLTGANRFGAVSATGTGGISITQGAGDMNVRQIVATGAVRLEATAGAIVADASTSVAGAGVELHALSNIGSVTDLRNRQGTAVAVNPGTGALVAHVADMDGHINLALASTSTPSAAPGSITAGGNGRLLIQSSGDLSLDAFDSAIGGFNEVGFSAEGTLSMPGTQAGLVTGSPQVLFLRGAQDIARSDRTFSLSASTLIFESGGQGGAVTLNTDVGLLEASIGNGASLTVVEANDIALGTVDAGGNLSISAASIQDDGDANGVTRVSAGNAVSLNGTNGIGSGANRIDTMGASVSIQSATGSVFVSHTGDVQLGGSAGGAIDADAPTGSITVASGLHSSGPLTLTAGSTNQAGNILLNGAASSAGAATLSTLGGGAINDSDDASVHLSAQELTLSSGTIGSLANRLSVDAVTLNAAADSVYVQDANALQLRSIAGQTVVIGAAGALADDGDDTTRVSAPVLSLSGAAVGAAGNEIDINAGTLSASAATGGIFISEQDDVQIATVSAAGDVALTAIGAITDDADDATRISGGQLILTAASIGAAGAELDTQVASLTATAAAGGIHVNEADDLQLNAISATDIAITSAGALSDDGNDTTQIAGSTVRLAGARIGASDNRIDTAATSLTLTAANGGIYFAEADDVALTEVRSSGTGNAVDGRTGGNGSMTVQTLVTQGGAVNLAAGGTGSLTVTGAIESNNGVVNLISGDALALPGLDTGTGSVVLRTVNDLNVGTITSSSVSITSDTGNVMLGTINAAGGTVTITADNGSITDGADTSLTAGQATLSARQIGGPGEALDVEVDTLTATASGGGIYINDDGSLTLGTISAAGDIDLVTTGLLTQTADIASGGHGIAITAGAIAMQAGTGTISGGGNITYVANDGNATLSVLDAAAGRALVIASDNVYSALAANSGINNLTAAAVEVRAGGLGGSPGEIGTLDAPLAIATSGGGAQSVYLIVPAVNGIQTSTPSISFAGSSGSLLLKGYTGSTGVLLFDLSSTFSPDTLLSGDETIVPLRNGRVAVNSDSLSAAKQALSSGVVARINVDWAAFDPNVSLFGTLDPALRLPADQVDEAAPAAALIPEGSVLVVSRDGWRLIPAT